MVDEWIINRIGMMDRNKYAHKVSKDGKWLYTLCIKLPEGSFRHCEDRGSCLTVGNIAPAWTLDLDWFGQFGSKDFSEDEIISAMEFIQTG